MNLKVIAIEQDTFFLGKVTRFPLVGIFLCITEFLALFKKSRQVQ
jgi:hypothetical protein